MRSRPSFLRNEKDFGWERWDSRDAYGGGRREAFEAPDECADGRKIARRFYGVCLTGQAGGECQPARDLRRLDREC
jgi:hypothetical protein